MKIAIALTVATCLAAITMDAQIARPVQPAPQQLSSGLTLRVPATWTLSPTQEGAALIPPSHSQQDEVYAVGLLPGVKDLNDPQLQSALSGQLAAEGTGVRPAGQPFSFQAEGGAGRVHAYDFAKDGIRGRMLFFLVGLRGGGVALLLAVGTPELLTTRHSDLAAIASSLSQGAAAHSTTESNTQIARPAPAQARTAGATPLTRQWTQHLNDKKLVQFSGYNSGYGSGGYSSEKKLYLASDGSYAFRSSSSVSVYVPGATGSSAGRSGQDGRWRVIEQGGQPLLELLASDGTKELIRLSMDGSKTFLNGNRWFVVGINE
jgi:hypothetical protein